MKYSVLESQDCCAHNNSSEEGHAVSSVDRWTLTWCQERGHLCTFQNKIVRRMWPDNMRPVTSIHWGAIEASKGNCIAPEPKANTLFHETATDTRRPQHLKCEWMEVEKTTSPKWAISLDSDGIRTSSCGALAWNRCRHSPRTRQVSRCEQIHNLRLYWLVKRAAFPTRGPTYSF